MLTPGAEIYRQGLCEDENLDRTVTAGLDIPVCIFLSTTPTFWLALYLYDSRFNSFRCERSSGSTHQGTPQPPPYESSTDSPSYRSSSKHSPSSSKRCNSFRRFNTCQQALGVKSKREPTTPAKPAEIQSLQKHIKKMWRGVFDKSHGAGPMQDSPPSIPELPGSTIPLELSSERPPAELEAVYPCELPAGGVPPSDNHFRQIFPDIQTLQNAVGIATPVQERQRHTSRVRFPFGRAPPPHTPFQPSTFSVYEEATHNNASSHQYQQFPLLEPLSPVSPTTNNSHDVQHSPQPVAFKYSSSRNNVHEFPWTVSPIEIALTDDNMLINRSALSPTEDETTTVYSRANSIGTGMTGSNPPSNAPSSASASSSSPGEVYHPHSPSFPYTIERAHPAYFDHHHRHHHQQQQQQQRHSTTAPIYGCCSPESLGEVGMARKPEGALPIGLNNPHPGFRDPFDDTVNHLLTNHPGMSPLVSTFLENDRRLSYPNNDHRSTFGSFGYESSSMHVSSPSPLQGSSHQAMPQQDMQTPVASVYASSTSQNGVEPTLIAPARQALVAAVVVNTDLGYVLSPTQTSAQLSLTPSVIECLYCKQTFTGVWNIGNRERHVRLKHRSPEEGNQDLTCQWCGRNYQRKDAKKKHEWKKHRKGRPPMRRGRTG